MAKDTLPVNDVRRSRLYGRRLGRPLSALRVQALELVVPHLGLPEGDIDLHALFPGCTQFGLEIGFGGGEHLLSWARGNPDWGLIGCEPFVNGVAQFSLEVSRAGLRNVRLFQGDARDLLPRFSSAQLSKVFLLFPDPWPKRRHWKRRFIQPHSVVEFARVLMRGGELRVATDHSEYASWIMMHFQHARDFGWRVETSSDFNERAADWPPTRYEEKARAKGLSPIFLRYIRR